MSEGPGQPTLPLPPLPTRASVGSGWVWPWRVLRNQGPEVHGTQSQALKRAQHSWHWPGAPCHASPSVSWRTRSTASWSTKVSRVGLYAGHHRVTPRGWCLARTRGCTQTTRLVDCNLPTHNEEKIGSKREKADGTPNPPWPQPRPQMVEQITPWTEGQTNSDPDHRAELYGALA